VRILKILLWLTLSLVLLVGIGVGVFVATFDPNSYRELLGKTIERSTGRRLIIEGDLSLAVWPKIALRAEQLSLANPDNFDAQPMLTADALEATVAVEPLLRREVNIDGVALYSPVVALQENSTGENNWSDLLAHLNEDKANDTDISDGRARDAQKDDNTEIQLNSVILHNATITLRSPEQQLSLQALNAELDFGTNDTLAITGSGSWQADSESAPADFSLSTKYTANGAATLLEQLNLSLILEAASGINEEVQLRIPAVRLDADLRQLEIEQGSATLANTTLDFAATVTDLQTTPHFKASVTTAGADTQALFRLADLKLPDTVPVSQLGELEGTAELSGALAGNHGGAISVHSFAAKLRGLGLEATGSMELAATGAAQGQLRLGPLNLETLARTLPELLDPDLFKAQGAPGDQPILETLQTDFAWAPAPPTAAQPAVLSFSNTRITALGLGVALQGTTRLSEPTATTTTAITFDEFSPKQVLTYFLSPIETEDPNALTSASGTLTLQQDATGTQLRDLKMSVDKSQLNGTVALLAAPVPKLRFEVALDRLNASSYLAPAPTPAKASPSAAAATTDVLGDLVLPTELLRSYDLDGTFRINQLQLFDLQLGDAGARIKLGDGSATLNNLSARLYDGSFIGKVAFRERDTSPELAITGDLQRVDIAPWRPRRAPPVPSVYNWKKVPTRASISATSCASCTTACATDQRHPKPATLPLPLIPSALLQK